MSNKKISVIIITLNEEELIEGVLLLLRDVGDIEIIVSDGGSIDRTCRVAKKYTEKIVRGEKGRIEILKRKIKTCARAWEKHGVLKTTLRNWAYVTLFFMGYSPYKLHERYYRKNIKHTMQRDVIKQRKNW